MKFDWDPEKAERNLTIHGVSFDEACELFISEVDVFEIYDVEHSIHEDRFKSIGPIRKGIVVVVWTERIAETIRIISAWMATKNEIQLYHEFVEGLNE